MNMCIFSNTNICYMLQRAKCVFHKYLAHGNTLAGFSPPRNLFPRSNKFWKHDRTNNTEVHYVYFLLPKAHF